MDLKAFDGKYARITTEDGEIFEGECSYSSPAYTEYLVGVEKEGLKIDRWLFMSDEIVSAEPVPQTDTFIWMNLRGHRMRLAYDPFDRIDRGEKTIELRLYDEKRRRIRPGDAIRFECPEDEDVLYVRVNALRVFPSFAELYENLPLTACGYREEELPSASPEDMRRYYSEEDEKRYGVVGIEIEML